MKILAMIFELIFFTTILAVYLVIDKIILHKRLKETQIAWDEYSKDMTWQERLDCIAEWEQKHKAEKGYRHFYMPQMNHIKPTVFQTTINGVFYRGTKQEISRMSGVDLKILESFDGLPTEIKIEQINKE